MKKHDLLSLQRYILTKSHLTFTYPIVWLTAGASLEILQPSFSTLQSSQLSAVWYSFQGQSVFDIAFPSFSLPLRLPPWTVPCRTVLASPDDCVMCLYYLSLRLFAEVRRFFIGPDDVFNSGFHFFVGYVISVRDTKEFAEASHLSCLYPSFNVCCLSPHFTCMEKYGHDQGMHQSDLGADSDVLVVPDDF